MNYQPLTLNRFLEFINHVKPKPYNPYVIYTGERGLEAFNLAMMFGEYPKIKFSVVYPKRSSCKTYINLLDKHGLWKVKYYRNRYFKFQLFKGTIKVLSSDKISNIIDYVKTNN